MERRGSHVEAIAAELVTQKMMDMLAVVLHENAPNMDILSVILKS